MASMTHPERLKQVQGATAKLTAAIPDTFKGFKTMHDASGRDGAFPAKVKELMSLAISIAVRCDGCIAFHTHRALRHGATREEVAETIAVAITMGGGPSTVYGADAWRAYEEFTAPA
jgi:AhpD family alkylhydroperoxidase